MWRSASRIVVTVPPLPYPPLEGYLLLPQRTPCEQASDAQALFVTCLSNPEIPRLTPPRRYALVVDDHPFMAHGLTTFLGLQEGLDEAVHTGSAHEALHTIVRCGRPVLALVDFWLPEGATDGLVRELLALAPQMRVLMTSGDDHPAVALKARASGAHGFVHKQQPPEVVAQAVAAVLAGGTWFPAASPSAAASSASAREVALHPADLGLTLRQGQALELLLQGLANKQIAAALNLSEHTVKDHVAAILERLGARNRVEAIARLRGVRLELPY